MSDDLDFDALNFSQGWHNDPQAVQAIVAADNLQPVSEYIGATGDRPIKTDLSVYLKKVHGDDWYIQQGSCGSCCAFGAALACDVLAAIQIVDHGMEKPVGRVDPMTIYWGSRVEIGGNSLWGQGSTGVWCAKYLKNYGILPQAKYTDIDLSKYDASVCCGGHARSGVPDSLETIARQHPVKSYAQVRTFEELARAIESGYPCTIASNQGFTKQRDSNGFARPQGSWSHQMCCVGIRHDIPGALIANSWGRYFSPPCDISDACFWADERTVSRMLSQGDSWALSDLSGWPKKSLNFARLNF
jgi:hypothetical protein